MKRFMKQIFWICCFCLLFTGCQKQEAAENHTFHITASFYPVYLMALEVSDGIDGVTVENMAQPQTGCLHDYQMTIADRKKLENSDIFLINGLGMESFLEDAMEQCPDLQVGDTSAETEALCAEEHDHDHGDDHDAEEEEVNAHIWLSLENAMVQVENIRDILCQSDPVHAEAYTENAAAFLKQAEILLAQYPHQHGTEGVFIFHEGFPYLAEHFGFVAEQGIFPEENDTPTAKELTDAVEEAKADGIQFFFAADDAGLSYAKILAEEVDGMVVVLDPITSGAGEKGEFLTRMEQNMRTLAEIMEEGGVSHENS